MNNVKDISIIIVNWNTKDLLRNCLNSIIDHDINSHIEIIVIDNGSVDASADMIQDEFTDVKLIKNTVNKGFAVANNQGANIALGTYLLFLNSDTLVIDNAIDEIKTFADKQNKAGAFGCLILNKDKTIQPSCMAFTSFFNLMSRVLFLARFFPNSKIFGNADMTWFKYDEIKEVDALKGCFILIRRETFISIGLFDENFFFYGEDMDLCFRLASSGLKNVFYPGARIIHFGGASITNHKNQYKLILWINKLKFIGKHHGRFYYALCYCAVNLLFLIRSFAWFFYGSWNANLRNEAWYTARSYFKGLIFMLIFKPKILLKKLKI